MMEILVSNEGIYEGNLILVNGDFPLRNESISLMPVNEKYPQVLLQAEAAQMLRQALRSIKADGCKDGSVSENGCRGEGERKEIQKEDTMFVNGCCCGKKQTDICKESIALVSGYRSEKEQTDIYKSSLKENGAEFTAKFVALPNHSEHQTGLAIDLGLEKENIDFICPDFPYEGICEKFRAVASQYGFIERYTKGKENITKIASEPWHFRYTGFPHSAIMSENNFALEEYIEYLKQFSDKGEHLEYDNARTHFEIFYVKAEKAGNTKIMLPYHTDGAASAYKISGNNADGFIITCAMH